MEYKFVEKITFWLTDGYNINFIAIEYVNFQHR